MLELTCDVAPSHGLARVVSWDEATRLGWTYETVDVYRCPRCNAPAPHVPEQRKFEVTTTILEPPASADRVEDGDAPGPEVDAGTREVWGWVRRAQEGDTDAFGLIYERYVDTVFRFVYFRVGSRPLAEDLVQEAFVRALKRITSFTWQGRDLGAWLVTIARNLVADHFKSGRFRLEVTTGDVLDSDEHDRSPEGNPAQAVVDHITNVELLEAVKQLAPEQQQCLVYRFLRQYSVQETAAAMDKNEGAIKALQYRAVRALARQLPEGFMAGVR